MWKSLLAVGLFLFLTLPASAQRSSTNDCTGQPSITDSTSGSNNPITITAHGGGNSQDFTIQEVNNCLTPGAGVDSVFCFTPEATCTPRVELTSGVSALGDPAIAVLNLIQGSCVTTVNQCVGAIKSANPGDSVSLAGIELTGGRQYCYIGSQAPEPVATQSYTLFDSLECGALPVEIQEFSVE